MGLANATRAKVLAAAASSAFGKTTTLDSFRLRVWDKVCEDTVASE